MGKAEGRRGKARYNYVLGLAVFLCVFSLVAGTARAARFVDNGDGTVTDTQTGLMWQQADDGVLRNWDEAVAYCESLVLPSPGGHNDWRAPRIDELETIINYATFNPAGFDPPSYGPFSTRSYPYWSSSTAAFHADYAWFIDFDEGIVETDAKFHPYYVRCVRGGPFWPFDPSTDFQTPAGKPDVVLDTWWGYMWQKGDSGEGKNWADANTYCNTLPLDGGGWRLPEIEALATIVDYTHYNPALSNIFDPRRSNLYWSGTDVNAPEVAWGVYFEGGYVYGYYKTRDLYVRCVRGGPGSLVPLTLNKLGSGTGRVTSDPTRIDCGTSCPSQTANFAVLTQVTLTAQADAGSWFVGWSGGGCSGTGTCQFTMGTDPVTVTARFQHQAAVPTFSQWGLIIFAILTAASAVSVIRRRQRS